MKHTKDCAEATAAAAIATVHSYLPANSSKRVALLNAVLLTSRLLSAINVPVPQLWCTAVLLFSFVVLLYCC
jgi:hypothetical protein